MRGDVLWGEGSEYEKPEPENCDWCGRKTVANYENWLSFYRHGVIHYELVCDRCQKLGVQPKEYNKP